jgi:TolB-like protein/Flp pilus assembly protein TadD
MEGKSPNQASTPAGAVFLSYASQDAKAAKRICEALRAGGIEVWFDQSELRGGDAWDRQIRQQIHDCRLFIAVISAHTEARDEGYFRREWKLAVDRTHDMAEKKAFIVPVVIDGTSERGASVPEKFRELQWTRLGEGETPPAFVERVRRLLSQEASTTTRAPANAVSGALPSVRNPVPWSPRSLMVIVAAVVAGAVAYLAIEKPWISKPAVSTSRVAASLATGAFAPPPHSIAVLPFVNMSGDKEQEYFSDGLSEELLTDLARINELQVAARTSAFSFKGKDTDIASVAHKLNVGSVLEGSVRRSGNTIRVTTQLINAVTGFHVWSQTYDRDLGDILKLQTEIANAVANALKVALLGDVAGKIELGGTRNPAAFDAYLRATKGFIDRHARSGMDTAIANYTKAIELDSNYATAYASRSIAYAYFALDYATGPSMRGYTDKAEVDARKALALAPDLALGHLALGSALETALDFWGARTEYERAINFEPGNATIQEYYGYFAACMGDAGGGLNALRRALTLDPLNISAQNDLGLGLMLSRRFEEALEVLNRGHALYPQDSAFAVNIGISQYVQGDYQGALKSCEQEDENPFLPMCLAIAYDKLGRHADAEAKLKRIHASEGVAPFLYSQILAQWGQINRALDSLETAMRQRSPYLEQLKTAPLFDPIRKEPRFQAIERELRFPD